MRQRALRHGLTAAPGAFDHMAIKVRKAVAARVGTRSTTSDLNSTAYTVDARLPLRGWLQIPPAKQVRSEPTAVVLRLTPIERSPVERMKDPKGTREIRMVSAELSQRQALAGVSALLKFPKDALGLIFRNFSWLVL